MVAPDCHLFGRVAAGVGDRHFKHRGDPTRRTGPGFGTYRTPLRIGGRADVTVNVDQAGQDVLAGRVDCLRRIDDVINSGYAQYGSAFDQQCAVAQAVRGDKRAPGDG